MLSKKIKYVLRSMMSWLKLITENDKHLITIFRGRSVNVQKLKKLEVGTWTDEKRH